LLNPYGANLYCYLWSFVNKSQFMGMDEVLPLWTMPTAGYTLAFFAIGWQALVSRRKSLPAESFLVCAGATIASVLVRRYGSLSVILLWPYFGLAFSQINWQRYTWLPKLSQLHVAILAAASLLISGVMWYTGCSSETSAKNLYTEGSFRSLLLVNAYLNGKDRIFNDPLTGDWLILCTDVPVYVDTRYDMYPKIFCEDAYACLWGAAGTLDYMKGHGVTHILVMDGFPPINKLLDQSSDWTLIIDDGRVSFWGRNSPEEVKRMAGMQLTDCQIGASRLPLELIKKTVGRRAQAVAAQAKTSSRPKP